MLKDLHIVIAETGDKIVTLYSGADFAKANDVFEKAEAAHEAVRLFNHPMPTRMRYPAQEAADIARRADEDKARQKAAKNAVQTAADAKRKQAEKLIAEAEALENPPAPQIESDPAKAPKTPKDKAPKTPKEPNA